MIKIKKVKHTTNMDPSFVTYTFQAIANAATPSTQGVYKGMQDDMLEDKL
jgi:hypothetical protein